VVVFFFFFFFLKQNQKEPLSILLKLTRSMLAEELKSIRARYTGLVCNEHPSAIPPEFHSGRKQC